MQVREWIDPYEYIVCVEQSGTYNFILLRHLGHRHLTADPNSKSKPTSWPAQSSQLLHHPSNDTTDMPSSMSNIVELVPRLPTQGQGMRETQRRLTVQGFTLHHALQDQVAEGPV
ncbi:hypothetical protein BD310DRAFT_511748 [Dichomitus squalens]|uniref:Uncharacterized protein n=1 Tax=Dichomitus squalens TaxID=114155 RepID=A0A4Q9PTZ2_9APHY|nr:hypothetical protein BD310DRAFT_511748 [Dichomitus squalens]